MTCSEGSVIPECSHDLVATDGNSNTKRIKHEKAAMIKMFTEVCIVFLSTSATSVYGKYSI